MTTRPLILLLAASTLVTGCSTGPSPDERDPLVYYDEKDRSEAEARQRKAARDGLRDAGVMAAISAGVLSITAGAKLLAAQFNESTPSDYAKLMQDSTNADNRRKGINGLVGPYGYFAQRDPYTTRYRQVAQGIPTANVPPDPDYVVRAVAIRALNRSRDRNSAAAFVEALADKSDLVRLEAAKALNNLPDPSAAGPLAATVANPAESIDVRIAAAEALRHYPTLEVARALVSVLDEREFAIAWQARRSLRRLTGSDFRYDQGRWLTYFSNQAKPFV